MGTNTRVVGVGSVFITVKDENGQDIIAVLRNVLHVRELSRRDLTIGYSGSPKLGGKVLLCFWLIRWTTFAFMPLMVAA
jgi:hypothetical protein